MNMNAEAQLDLVYKEKNPQDQNNTSAMDSLKQPI